MAFDTVRILLQENERFSWTQKVYARPLFYFFPNIKSSKRKLLACDPADQLQGSLPAEVPESVPENGGVRRSVHGVFLEPFGPRAPECHSGTLFGHSGARDPKGPRDTLWDTPVFGDTLGDFWRHRSWLLKGFISKMALQKCNVNFSAQILG